MQIAHYFVDTDLEDAPTTQKTGRRPRFFVLILSA